VEPNEEVSLKVLPLVLDEMDAANEQENSTVIKFIWNG
jgi:hypothetical protein